MIRRTGRFLNALAVWTIMVSFGIYIGFLALFRSLERKGAGGRWRRSDARGEEIDAILNRPDESALDEPIPAEETQPRT